MTRFQPFALARTAPWFALSLLVACVTPGMNPTEPAPDHAADAERSPDDQSEGADLSAFAMEVTDEMMALEPPEDTPQPLMEQPAEEARLTCEKADADGNQIIMEVEGGYAVLRVVDSEGAQLVEEQFELDSVKRDNMPRYWLSGPDIQLAYTSNYGCANAMRVRANAGSDGFRYVFPSCRAHNNMDEQCMRK